MGKDGQNPNDGGMGQFGWTESKGWIVGDGEVDR